MNIAEANLLLGSVDDLSRTLMANKLEKRRRGELDRREALERDQLGLRREELGAAREERAESRADLAAHRETMAQIQRETKEMQDRHYRLMQSTGLLKQIQEGLASGTISPEKMKAGLADNPLLKELGLGVDLFQAPSAKAGFETREGHDLALAEKYRERATAARRNNAGDEAERFMAIADRLERGGRPETEPMADVTEEVGDVDPLTGKGAASVRRRIPESRLEEVLKQKAGKPAGPPADQFETVGAAREAGKKAGDIIMLYDPAQKRYRKFQLE